ncbi:MAG: hypothetical protein J5756_05460 [Clostridia bacterium]|nr:hypothetical protein [Clostridia bacterium]
MEWTDREIEQSYLNAKDKKAQISKLAELNACSIQTICEILRKAGIEPQLKRKYVKHANKQQPAAETQQKPTPPPPSVESVDASSVESADVSSVKSLDITPDEGGLIADVLKHTLARCSQEIFDLKRRAKELEEKLAEQEQIEKTLSALIDKFEVLIDVC